MGRSASSVNMASKLFHLSIKGVDDLSDHQKAVRKLRATINKIQGAYPKEGELFYDKIGFKTKLTKSKVRVPKTYSYMNTYNKDTFNEDFDKFWDVTNSLNEFIFKPNHLSQGRHVYSIHKINDKLYEPDDKEITKEQLKKVTAGILKGKHVYKGFMIEELINSHPSLKELHGQNGIADMRIYMLYDVPIFGKLRLPTKLSHGYGNTGRNAVAVYCNFSTMKFEESNTMNNIVRIHPDTGTNLIGKPIPFGTEMVNVATVVSKLFDIPFHSVDMTVNEKGEVIVIEGEKIPLLSHFTPAGVTKIMELINLYSGVTKRYQTIQ